MIHWEGFSGLGSWIGSGPSSLPFVNDNLPYSKENRREEAGHTWELMLGTSGRKMPAERPYGELFSSLLISFQEALRWGTAILGKKCSFKKALRKLSSAFLGQRASAGTKGRLRTQAQESMCAGDSLQQGTPCKPVGPPCTERPSLPAHCTPAGFGGPPRRHPASLIAISSRHPWTGQSLLPGQGTTEAASTRDPSFTFLYMTTLPFLWCLVYLQFMWQNVSLIPLFYVGLFWKPLKIDIIS